MHIPYKGGGRRLVDLLAGQVQMLFAPPGVVPRSHIQSGRIRALAVSTAKRSAACPDLPTIAESRRSRATTRACGMAMLAPGGTPREIVERLNRETLAVLKQPDYAKFLFSSAIDPVGSTPEELATYIKSEIAKYAKVIKEAGVHVD